MPIGIQGSRRIKNLHSPKKHQKNIFFANNAPLFVNKSSIRKQFSACETILTKTVAMIDTAKVRMKQENLHEKSEAKIK